MTLVLDHAPYDRCRGAVAAAADRLAADRERAGRRVAALLAGGWEGRAADSFAAAWADWEEAAERLADGLATTAALLGSVARELGTQDDAAAVPLERLSTRIAERLG